MEPNVKIYRIRNFRIKRKIYRCNLQRDSFFLKYFRRPIVIGVEDDGTVVGVDKIDETFKKYRI